MEDGTVDPSFALESPFAADVGVTPCGAAVGEASVVRVRVESDGDVLSRCGAVRCGDGQ